MIIRSNLNLKGKDGQGFGMPKRKKTMKGLGNPSMFKVIKADDRNLIQDNRL